MPGSELLDVERSLVIVIDPQGKLMEMIHRPRLVTDAINRLMILAGIFKVPVILTEQYPEGLGGTIPEIRTVFDGLDTETGYVSKKAFGCCGEPAFLEAIDRLIPAVPRAERQYVVAGIEAHVCVMQTVIELLRTGGRVHLCWEAVSCRGEEYRRHALDRMQQAGAVITNHESVGFEWARHKDHRSFREMSRLFKQGQLT